MNSRISVLLVACIVSGCSLGWARPNTTEAQFYQDRLACEQQAASMYPSQPSQQSQSYKTNCSSYGNQTNCTSKPDPFANQSIDISISQRASVLDVCLRSKGYTRGN